MLALLPPKKPCFGFQEIIPNIVFLYENKIIFC
jgi:hypothetical protein